MKEIVSKLLGHLIEWFILLGMSFWSLIIQVEHLFTFCSVFIISDFILGIMTSLKSAKIKNERFGIESDKLYKTLIKIVCMMFGIGLSVYYQNNIEISIPFINGEPNFANMITGIIAAFELYSIFGHLIYLSDWKALQVIRDIFKKEIESKTGHNID